MPTGRFTGETLRQSRRTFDILDAIDHDGRPAVIKRAHDPSGLSGLDGRRLEREARLGRMLGHAGLATVLDYGIDWIAFERLERSLLDAPAGIAPFTALKDIAETLAHLHARGVVHRDLKPSHILFRGKRAVLIDLGVAGLIGGTDSLDTGEIVGSPAWMAPEQMLGAAPAPSADIWSFCAIAHRLLNSRPLYSGTAEAVLDTRRANPGATPDFSSLADDSLAAMLDAGFADPEERPSARALAAALSEAGFGAPDA